MILGMKREQARMIMNICERELIRGNNKVQIKRLYLDIVNAFKQEEIKNEI